MSVNRATAAHLPPAAQDKAKHDRAHKQTRFREENNSLGVICLRNYWNCPQRDRVIRRTPRCRSWDARFSHGNGSRQPRLLKGRTWRQAPGQDGSRQLQPENGRTWILQLHEQMALISSRWLKGKIWRPASVQDGSTWLFPGGQRVELEERSSCKSGSGQLLAAIAWTRK